MVAEKIDIYEGFDIMKVRKTMTGIFFQIWKDGSPYTVIVTGSPAACRRVIDTYLRRLKLNECINQQQRDISAEPVGWS